ncbi:MAG: hypothetical protein GC154_17290 [bacterium]|nr:hypothetical protein [bacterium]
MSRTRLNSTQRLDDPLLHLEEAGFRIPVNRDGVRDFVDGRDDRVSFLIQSHREIFQRFAGARRVNLETFQNVEEDEADQLVVSIELHSNVEPAVEALRVFERDWWLPRLDDPSQTILTLKYVE